MFSKKSSGSKKTHEPTPKGAILTPPENLYIPESHFVPEQYMTEQYMPLAEPNYIQDSGYKQQESPYLAQESAYLTQEQPYIQPEPTHISQIASEPVQRGPTQLPLPVQSIKPPESQSTPAKLGNSMVYPIDASNVKVLFDGYSKFVDGDYFANCTCTLIKGGPNIVVDTMTVWDEQKLTAALRNEGLNCDDIDFVICTHGHSDHTGCNHLFKNAIHIVGFSISHKDQYYLHPDFRHGEEFNIDPSTNAIKIVPTPGHTLQDVTVLVYTNIGTIAISGDLFEKAEDLENEYEWLQAGSDNASLQRRNRQKILELADYIIPGHGPIFKVPERFKKIFEKKALNACNVQPMGY